MGASLVWHILQMSPTSTEWEKMVLPASSVTTTVPLEYDNYKIDLWLVTEKRLMKTLCLSDCLLSCLPVVFCPHCLFLTDTHIHTHTHTQPFLSLHLSPLPGSRMSCRVSRTPRPSGPLGRRWRRDPCSSSQTVRWPWGNISFSIAWRVSDNSEDIWGRYETFRFAPKDIKWRNKAEWYNGKGNERKRREGKLSFACICKDFLKS